ncbi:MAG TPA: flippase [Gemmatimonadaceae bacterium]|nr:flippase [Gemmatimonadaceae bacterium]
MSAEHGVHRLTRGRLLARNVLLNLGGSALPALAALVAVPILVRTLGDARFGVLALAWTALGYFSLFDLGIGRAVTHGVAARLGADVREDEEIAVVIWTALATLIPIGVLGFAVLYGIAPWLTERVLNVPQALRAETITSFRVLAVAIPFVGATAALRGSLEARQMFGAVNALRLPHGLVTFLGPLLALPFSRSLVPACAILTVGRVALFLAHLIIVTRLVAGFRDAPARWNRAAVRPLLAFGGWMTVSNIISPLMNTLDRFVVGAVLTVSVLTYYAAPNELVIKMWLFTAALHPVFFPAMATTGARDPERTSMLFDRLLRITFAGLLLPVAILVLLAPEILRVWLGANFVLRSGAVLQVLAIAVFVNTLGQAGLVLIQALGRPDITGKYHAAELPFYALLLWFLLPRFGILGAAIAWSVRAVVDAIVLLLTCPALLPHARAPVKRCLGWLAVTVPVLAAGMFVHSNVRIVLAIAAVPAWLLIVWLGVLTAEERRAPARAVSAAWRPERA